jgi:hypothetical protein
VAGDATLPVVVDAALDVEPGPSDAGGDAGADGGSADTGSYDAADGDGWVGDEE